MSEIPLNQSTVPVTDRLKSEVSVVTTATPTTASVTLQETPARKNFLQRFFSLENRFLAPLLITSILIVGHFTFAILEDWRLTLLAIATSICIEIVLGKLFTGKIPHLASAYISGISVGILIRSPFLWPFAMCAAISILSKYVLRYKNRHLWNPSNFGVSAMLFLYPAYVATLSIQWGNNLWAMMIVWCLGSLIIYRLKRFHICLTYVISFVALSGLRSAITGNPFLASVAPLTGPMYQLFVFFMITDPKTTVKSKLGQCVVVFFVAVAEMIFRLNQVVHAPYFALFIVGPIANAIDIYLHPETCKTPTKAPIASASTA